MEVIPVKTRVLVPPQDDLFSVLDTALGTLKEGDVIVVSSKVVSINEGRCLLRAEHDKRKLAEELADLMIPRSYWGSSITVVHHAFIGYSGIDESNGNGYLILLPEDPFASARRLQAHLCKRFGLKNLGVVITDSKSDIFRFGATGVAIGWWGIRPLKDHRGESDIFGRTIKAERANVVDGIAATATLVAGEVAKQTPIIIVRGMTDLEYTNEDTRNELLCPYAEDKFRVLYEGFLKE